MKNTRNWTSLLLSSFAILCALLVFVSCSKFEDLSKPKASDLISDEKNDQGAFDLNEEFVPTQGPEEIKEEIPIPDPEKEIRSPVTTEENNPQKQIPFAPQEESKAPLKEPEEKSVENIPVKVPELSSKEELGFPFEILQEIQTKEEALQYLDKLCSQKLDTQDKILSHYCMSDQGESGLCATMSSRSLLLERQRSKSDTLLDALKAQPSVIATHVYGDKIYFFSGAGATRWFQKVQEKKFQVLSEETLPFDLLFVKNLRSHLLMYHQTQNWIEDVVIQGDYYKIVFDEEIKNLLPDLSLEQSEFLEKTYIPLDRFTGQGKKKNAHVGAFSYDYFTSSGYAEITSTLAYLISSKKLQFNVSLCGNKMKKAPSAGCGHHGVLVQAVFQEGDACRFRIQNSWGDDWGVNGLKDYSTEQLFSLMPFDSRDSSNKFLELTMLTDVRYNEQGEITNRQISLFERSQRPYVKEGVWKGNELLRGMDSYFTEEGGLNYRFRGHFVDSKIKKGFFERFEKDVLVLSREGEFSSDSSFIHGTEQRFHSESGLLKFRAVGSFEEDYVSQGFLEFYDERGFRTMKKEGSFSGYSILSEGKIIKFDLQTQKVKVLKEGTFAPYTEMPLDAQEWHYDYENAEIRQYQMNPSEKEGHYLLNPLGVMGLDEGPL